QNDEAKLRRLPTRSAKTSTLPLRKGGPMQAVAIPGSQFQKGALAVTRAAQQWGAIQRSFVPFGFGMRKPRGCFAAVDADVQLRFAAGRASRPRRDTKRKTERTRRH